METSKPQVPRIERPQTQAQSGDNALLQVLADFFASSGQNRFENIALGSDNFNAAAEVMNLRSMSVIS